MSAQTATPATLSLAERRQQVIPAVENPAASYLENLHARWAAEQNDLFAVGEHVQQIAKLLNLNFNQVRDTGGSNPNFLTGSFYLSDKNTNIYIQLVSYPKSKAGQLQVSSSYPRNLRGELPSYPAVRFDDSINIGANRTPEQAAKDIQNRFLPYHRKAYAAYLDAVARDSDRASVVHENLQRLVAAGGTRAKAGHNNNPKDSEQHFYHSHGDARVTDTQVYFDRMTLSVELAEKVLTLLAAHAPKK